MGDRGNIVIRAESETNTSDVWFYTHWSGYNIKAIVALALARKQRWDDPSYLARIVFDTLTAGQHGDSAGFGISTLLGDNEYPIIVINCPGQNVMEVPESSLVRYRLPELIGGFQCWMFGKFIEEFKPSDEETKQILGEQQHQAFAKGVTDAMQGAPKAGRSSTWWRRELKDFDDIIAKLKGGS
jgi:hypothetical protein